MKTLHLIILHNSITNIMSSPSTSMSKSSKRQKIVIIPPKHLIIDLTQDDNTTPSPPPQCSSPNAPSKTPLKLDPFWKFLGSGRLGIHQMGGPLNYTRRSP